MFRVTKRLRLDVLRSKACGSLLEGRAPDVRRHLFTKEPFLAPRMVNAEPLSPVTWLERAATIFPRRTAIAYGDSVRLNYEELLTEAQSLGGALSKAQIGQGDVVSVLLPNVPTGIVCHFAVPGTGAILHMINTRLDAKAIAFQLEHAESNLILVDSELMAVATEALEIMEEGQRPRLVWVSDPYIDDGEDDELKGRAEEYKEFLRTGDPDFELKGPQDEFEAIALSYTSGTTGNPKGVLTNHRGAVLNCFNLTIMQGVTRFVPGGDHYWGRWPMISKPMVYLWILPMFHCNGWCFPWSVTLVGGTHVCLRHVRAGDAFRAMANEGVTHFCGAPGKRKKKKK
ncbi:unnamed protein product [Discosporangium mesarthrocarpum]